MVSTLIKGGPTALRRRRRCKCVLQVRLSAAIFKSKKWWLHFRLSAEAVCVKITQALDGDSVAAREVNSPGSLANGKRYGIRKRERENSDLKSLGDCAKLDVASLVFKFVFRPSVVEDVRVHCRK